MLKRIHIVAEIWDDNTNEMLVDNLTFEQAAEQCAVYTQFFGAGVCVVLRETTRVITHRTSAQEFKNAWTSMFEELAMLGNLY